MTPTEYQPLAFRTAKLFPTIRENIEHAALGMTTELGEFATVIKRVEVYGKLMSLDMRANCREELADFAWYVALAATIKGWALSDAFKEAEEIEADDHFEMGPHTLKLAIFLMNSSTTAAWMTAHDEDDALLRRGLAMGVYGLQMACSLMGFDLSEMLNQNIIKLRDRFPEKYTDELAEARLDKGGLDATQS